MRSSILALCFVLCITIETVLSCAPSGSSCAGCPGLPNLCYGNTQCCDTYTSTSSGRPKTGGKRSPDVPFNITLDARSTCPDPTTNLVCRIVTNIFTHCDCCDWNVQVQVNGDGQICVIGGDCNTNNADTVVSCCRTSPRGGDYDVCNQKLVWDSAWGTGPSDYYLTGGTGYIYASEGSTAYVNQELYYGHPHTWAAAVDGLDGTYFDSAVYQSTDCFVAFDFKQPVSVAAAKFKIRPYAAATWGMRYDGHTVEGSNSRGGPWNVLGTVGSSGAAFDNPQWNFVPLDSVAASVAYRYLRFHGNDYCNYAEIEFDGCYQTCWNFDFPSGVTYGTWATPKCLTHDNTVLADTNFCALPDYGSSGAAAGRKRFDEESPVQQMFEENEVVRRDI